MKRSDLPLVTMDGRHAGAILAHPCGCGRAGCTLGKHVWDATIDMTPGPRAQTTDPRARSWAPDTGDDDGPDRPDPLAGLDQEYRRLVTAYFTAARDVTRFIDRHRPDRTVPLPDAVATDDMWCANHLDLVGICEPRHRGDLCRQCYNLQLAHSVPPDAQLLQAMRDHGRITKTAIEDFLARIKPARKTRNKQRRKKTG